MSKHNWDRRRGGGDGDGGYEPWEVALRRDLTRDILSNLPAGSTAEHADHLAVAVLGGVECALVGDAWEPKAARAYTYAAGTVAVGAVTKKIHLTTGTDSEVSLLQLVNLAAGTATRELI